MKEKWELAYNDYLEGMKYKDIAAKYGVTVSAVKSWKSRYWKDKKLQPKKSKVATKKVAKKIAKKMIEDNKELDEERQLFCIYYLKYHNATKAYLKIKPHVTYASASVLGGRLYKEPAVQEEIKKLKEDIYVDALLDPQDIIQKYIDIAFADITDYATFKGGWISLKDSDTVDGTIIQEVKQGKNGVSIKFGDRMKALEFLTKHIGMATEEQKAKIELIKAQANAVKAKSDEDVEEIENDGFIEALDSSAESDWEDYGEE